MKTGNVNKLKSQILIPPASSADKTRIETLVQHCLTAQGQAIVAYKAEMGAIAVLGYLELLSNRVEEGVSPSSPLQLPCGFAQVGS